MSAENSRRADRLLIEQAAEAGLLSRRARPELNGSTISELVAEAVASDDVLLQYEGRRPEEVLVAIVAGARTQAERLRVIELEASRQARMLGVPVRQLAQEVAMSERSAHDRYRKPRIRVDRDISGEDHVDAVKLHGASTDLEIVADLLTGAGIAHDPMILDGHGWAPDQLGGLEIAPADEAAASKVLDDNFFGVERLYEEDY